MLIAVNETTSFLVSSLFEDVQCFVCIQRWSVAKFDYLDEVIQKNNLLHNVQELDHFLSGLGSRPAECVVGWIDRLTVGEKSQVGCFRTMGSLVCSLRSNSKRFRGDFDCTNEP